MGTLIKADGTVQSVSPSSGKKFTLEEMQEYVGGDIQMVTLPKNKAMILNENGKLMGLPVNDAATIMLRVERNTNDFCVGDVLVIDRKEMK